MRIDPAIAALRRQPERQRAAQAAMTRAIGEWREECAVAAVLAEFAWFGGGASLAQCPALGRALAEVEVATGLVAALCDRLCRVLAAQPFGHPPLRHACDDRAASLLLAASGRARLTLHACEPGPRDHDSASFADGERRDLVLAGRALARIVRRTEDGPLACETRSLQRGSARSLDPAFESLQLLEVEQRLVVLRLQRDVERPDVTRTYAIPDGGLLHQAAGDLASSRIEAMLAVLGRMRRVEAAPAMAAIAAGDDPPWLRWQALRECLALDTASGLRVLGTLAASRADPLAAPAAALLARLHDEHPRLRAAGDTPCPA